jgi:hypothetical protein
MADVSVSLQTNKNTSISWCREGESIPIVLKGLAKIPPISVKRNIDTGLRRILPRWNKTGLGQLSVIWGDFGRSFTRKS